MNFVPNNNSKDQRNEQETRALQESGAHIARARFDSIPDSSELRGRLKAQILAKRELKRTSMWEKIKSALHTMVPTQKHFAGAIAVFLLVSIVGLLLVMRPDGQKNTFFAGTVDKLFISPVFAQDNFEVTPTEGDALAVESTTHFILKSKTSLDEKTLTDNITLEPAVDFSVEKINENEFRVTPKQPLGAKTIYNLKIATTYINDQNVEVARDFSWAFQVKNELKVARTLPGDKATGVPTNSGIEFTFNSEGYDKYEQAITFEPKLEGRFERHGRTLAFVPKSMKSGTIYTVKISKELTVKGAHPMKEDHVFQFETNFPSKYDSNAWYLHDNFIEFSSAQTPFVSVSDNQKEAGNFNVSVYSFSSINTFVDLLAEKQKYPNWSYSSRRQADIDVSTLQKVKTFDLPTSAYKYSTYVVFPEALNPGFYLVQIEKNNKKEQVLLQVSDLTTFVSVNENQTLVWVNNLKTQKAAIDANLQVKETGEKIALGTDGLTTLSTNKIFPSPKDRDGRSQAYLLVQSHNDSIVVPLYYGSNHAYDDPWAPSTLNDDYWNYTSLDRTVYLPNDTIAFWGMVKPRSGSPEQKKVFVEFEYGGYSFDEVGARAFYPKTELVLNTEGYFEGTLKTENMNPGYYNLVFKYADQVLARKYITIENYTKPAYTLSLKSDKNAIFGGESVTFQTEAQFFEGTPLPGLELNYHDSHRSGGQVKTDSKGHGSFVITAKNEKCHPLQEYCQSYSGSNYVDVRPTHSEEGDVSVSRGITVYPARVDLTTNFEYTSATSARVSSTATILDLDPLNNDDPSDDQKFRVGPAKNKKVLGIIRETSFTKVEAGEYYDFINKRVEKIYHYNRVDKEFARFTLVTDENGQVQYDILNVDKEKSYRVRLYVDDGFGQNAYDERYLFTPYGYENNSNYIWYSLYAKDMSHTSYQLGERVNLQLYKNEDPLQSLNGKVLYYELHKGLKNFTLSDSPEYSFEFTPDRVPNVYVNAVYFDGKAYRFTGDAWSRTNILYDTSEKKLNVAVSTDQREYMPGGDMKIKVKVTDQSGNPHASNLHIKVIDEAYYSIGGYDPNPLIELYRSVSSKELYSYSTHRFSELKDMNAGAEMGCFLSGTKILMADGSLKNIEHMKAGDKITTFESEASRKKVTATVLDTQRHLVSTYLVMNDTLKVTPEHIGFINGQWKTMGEAKVGDVMRKSNGTLETIRTITVKHDVVEVFNFHVEKYHTYIADGFYVHNDKGGGGGVRQFFPDVALFKMLETNANGEAEVTIKVPDSITSWRLTTEAISDDLSAGIDIQKVSVTLPLFAQVSFPKELLKGDAPYLALRAYGNGVKQNDTVQVHVEAPFLKDGKASTEGKPFASILVPFPSLSVGSFAVTSSIASGKHKDALLTRFTVVDTHLQRKVHEKVDISSGKIIPGASNNQSQNITGPIEMVISSEGQARLYHSLLWLLCDCGQRIDQRIGSVAGEDLMQQYFGWKENPDAEATNFAAYQDVSGGIKLLPYDSPDLVLSSKMVALAPDQFDRVKLSTYFYSFVINSGSHTREEVVVALYGLAALGEPVLPAIKNIGTLEKLTPKEQLYIALSASELGDLEYARKIYKSLGDQHMKVSEPIAKMDIGNSTSVLEHTALSAVLASSLNEKYADQLIQFVRDEPTTEMLTKIEELLFVKNSLPYLSPEPVEVTVKIKDQTETIKLEKGHTRSITIPSEHISQVSFVNIKGPVGAVIQYQVPLSTEINYSPLVSVDKKYYVNGKETNTFTEGDLVEIRLFPKIALDAPKGGYQIVDVLPSGLKTVISPYRYFNSVSQDHCRLYPYAVENQSLRFMMYQGMKRSNCSEAGWSYYARVSTLGTFETEPALIQFTQNPDILNIGGYDQKVTIQK